MAQQRINVGSGEYSGNGESLRSAFTKTNANFDEVYTNLNILNTSTTYRLVNAGKQIILDPAGVVKFSDGFTIDPITNQTAIYSGLITNTSTRAISIATGITTNGIFIPGTNLTTPANQGNTSTIRINGKNGVSIISGNDNFEISTSTWTFDTSGNLTLPVGGQIINLDIDGGDSSV